MLDIKFVRENPDAVKENIKKKFQDAKLPLVDEVIEKDAKYRAALKDVEALKALHVNLCMECGCCAYVCPAKRHLVVYNQLGKQMIRK